MTTSEPARHTLAEIASQPHMWTLAAQQAAAGTVLPQAGEPVLFVGCGTSYYIGDAYARLRNSLGLGRTRAAVASEIAYVDQDDTIVVLSRSGTTSDVITVARELKSSRRVLGIIGTVDSPLIGECKDVVMLDYADEISVVQTRFATTAFMLLRASMQSELDWLIGQAELALTRPLPPLREHVVFLGTGFSLGLAHEAALKCLESSGRWVEAYPTMEYQHGPISAAGPHTLVWPLVPVPDSVAEGIRATGAHLVTPVLDPQAELVTVHRMAVAMALAAGRDPDMPPHLSRSVQLV